MCQGWDSHPNLLATSVCAFPSSPQNSLSSQGTALIGDIDCPCWPLWGIQGFRSKAGSGIGEELPFL